MPTVQGTSGAMNSVAPIERIVGLLKEAGYQPLKTPLMVAKIPFEFAAVLGGAGRSLDLILVIDTVEESGDRIRQKVEAIGRALDVLGSRRPLTAVLVGPRPRSSILEAVGRVCRVLAVGTQSETQSDQSLIDWLAVLLPLSLPQLTDSVADSLGELERHLPDEIGSAAFARLIEAASGGSESVERELARIVSGPLDAIDNEMEE